MEKEQFTEIFTLSMTRREKKLLARLAYERGGTMSGFVRKLIRDAARGAEQPTVATAKGEDTHAG